MKTFRLIKEYPGSPQLNSTYSYDDFIGDFGKEPCFGMKEFWEEVVKHPVLTTYDGVELFINDTCYIPQEKINGGWYDTCAEFILTKSMVSNWRSDVAVFADKNKAEEFIKQNNITLTTKDGVTLKFGDIFYTVDVERFKVYKAFVSKKDRWTENAFSTRKLAEEWIENNKPKYSLSDISKSVNYWSMSPICKEDILKFLENGK